MIKEERGRQVHSPTRLRFLPYPSELRKTLLLSWSPYELQILLNDSVEAKKGGASTQDLKRVAVLVLSARFDVKFANSSS